MDLTITNSLNEETWRAFVDRHPQGNIFHTPEMFQVFGRTAGHHPMLKAAVGDEGQVLALLLPVQVTLRGGLFRRLTTTSIAYGSVLCAPEAAGREALALLLHTYAREAGRDVLFTELRNLTDLEAIQPVLAECGFSYEEHLDYVIDLNCSPEQVLQGIGPRTRKHIRHALRKGRVAVEQVTQRHQIGEWYGLVRETYAVARVPLADRSLFEAAFDILHPRGLIRFWLARIGTTYAAASAELVYKDMIYGWYGGMDRAYARDLPGELLMWHILEWGARAGYKTYDFGGAGKPGEAYGVRDFKAKFGGRWFCFGRNIRVHAPGLLRLSTLGYRILTSRFTLGQRFLNPGREAEGGIQRNPYAQLGGPNEE
jgi:serine/alanine adding enzyme